MHSNFVQIQQLKKFRSIQFFLGEYLKMQNITPMSIDKDHILYRLYLQFRSYILDPT